MNNKIIELMQVPEDVRDLNWLMESLQSAIDLELSTLPPYLCAMWSIKSKTDPVYQLIDGIVLEEMLHMGLACNMLTTIGGVPRINANIPTYPGPLPGGVRPQLTVYLAGVSKDYILNVCMEIEYPEGGPVTLAFGATFPTIGAFYQAIADVFPQFSSSITGNHQLTADFSDGNSLYAITNLADALKAIEEIREQGEGTSQTPQAVDFGGEFAHYYKFAEIWNEKTLTQINGQWQYVDPPIPFPQPAGLYPMSPIPVGGYVNPAAPVQQALDSFNNKFKSLLSNLEDAWGAGGADSLNAAINDMFGLKTLATNLMKMPLPDGSGGVYGPNFVI